MQTSIQLVSITDCSPQFSAVLASLVRSDWSADSQSISLIRGLYWWLPASNNFGYCSRISLQDIRFKRVGYYLSDSEIEKGSVRTCNRSKNPNVATFLSYTNITFAVSRYLSARYYRLTANVFPISPRSLESIRRETVDADFVFLLDTKVLKRF